VKGLVVNEYCLAHEQYAGRTAWLIAQVERAKIDLRCHAIWGDEGKGNLDGILFDARNGVPKGPWWAYQRNGALSGRLVVTTPTGRIDLVASLDESGKTAQVLLGNKGGMQGDVTLRVQGLDKAAYLRHGDQVHIIVERIPEESSNANCGKTRLQSPSCKREWNREARGGRKPQLSGFIWEIPIDANPVELPQ
jgi:hypothetical protein